MNKTCKISFLTISACFGLSLCNGCTSDKKSNHTTSQTIPQAVVKLETQPHKDFYLVGETFDVSGATLSIQFGNQQKEIIPITNEMVSDIDMSTPGIKKPLVTYRYHNQDYTTSFSITVADFVSVKTEEELTSAINDAKKDIVILLKKKDTPYNMHHLEILKSLHLRGEENVSIQIDSDPISSQAGIYIKASDVTIDNLTIEMSEKSLHSLKVSHNSQDTKVDNITFKDCTFEGGKGVNFHGGNNILLKNCTINVEDTSPSVALSIASSNVTIEDCTIYHGKWGSIGLMHKIADQNAPDYNQTVSLYPGNTKVIFKGENTISSIVYVEYSEESKNTIENLDWEQVKEGTTLIYKNPSLNNQ